MYDCCMCACSCVLYICVYELNRMCSIVLDWVVCVWGTAVAASPHVKQQQLCA
jgi:hypothetical protein